MSIKAALILSFLMFANMASALDLHGTNNFTGGKGIVPEASSTDSIYNQLDGIIRIPKAADGYYYAQALVNGVVIDFIVDTGASAVTLSYSDAKLARMDVETLDFSHTANTANGSVDIALTTIDKLKLHGYELQEITAVVTKSNFDFSLLGMSYLSLFSKVELTEEYLLLYP